MIQLMEMEIESRNYELAYHINPDLEESELKSRVAELEGLIAQNGGAIITSREPKRKHLSYPIRQKNYSYFGVMDFKAPPEAIDKISNQMKLQSAVLRHIVINHVENAKELKTLGSERVRPKMKTHEPSAMAETAKPKEEIKPEQLEREIEDVLGKI